jgi:hypothetical protein
VSWSVNSALSVHADHRLFCRRGRMHSVVRWMRVSTNHVSLMHASSSRTPAIITKRIHMSVMVVISTRMPLGRAWAHHYQMRLLIFLVHLRVG